MGSSVRAAAMTLAATGWIDHPTGGFAWAGPECDCDVEHHLVDRLADLGGRLGGGPMVCQQVAPLEELFGAAFHPVMQQYLHLAVADRLDAEYHTGRVETERGATAAEGRVRRALDV